MRVPFLFAPVPVEAVRRLADGSVSHVEFLLLAYLYNRASRSNWTTRFTLAQAAEGIGWAKTLDYLSKILRGLRDKGWIHYRATPGRRGHIYAVELFHEPQQGSERRRRTKDRKAPKTGPGKLERERELVDAVLHVASQDPRSPGISPPPSTGIPSPSTRDASRPHSEPDPAQPHPSPFRIPQSVQEELNAFSEERVLGEDSAPGTTTLGKGEKGDPLEQQSLFDDDEPPR
jgi:hypothetical protein